MSDQNGNVMLRKSFTDLSDNERVRFANALNILFDEGKKDNLIQVNADLHAKYFNNGIHWGPAFLPWHRDYLRKFELAIQTIESDLFLPFWDWTRDDSRDIDIEPWKSIFGGRKNKDGKFDHWNYKRRATPENWVLPTLSGEVANSISVVDELDQPNFQLFRGLDHTSAQTNDTITFICVDGTKWVEQGRSDNT